MHAHPPSKAGPIAIVGAGISGLAAAHALERAGFETRLFEARPTVSPPPTGLLLPPNAMQALDALGLGEPMRERATPISTIAIKTRTGRSLVGPHPAWRDAHGMPALWGLSLADLLAIFQRVVPAARIQLGTPIESVRRIKGGVIVETTEGLRCEAPRAILADGIETESADWSGRLLRRTGYTQVAGIAQGLRLYESGGFTAWRERDRCYCLWDVGNGATAWRYTVDDRGFVHGQHRTRSQLLNRARHWPEEIGMAIAATPEDLIVQGPVFTKAPPRHLGRGHILRVGDAVHPIVPFTGQCIAQTLEDAVALEAAAQRKDVSLLRLYERLRLKRTRSVVLRGARLGSLLHGLSPWEARFTQMGLKFTPDFLLSAWLGRDHRMPSYHAIAATQLMNTP